MYEMYYNLDMLCFKLLEVKMRTKVQLEMKPEKLQFYICSVVSMLLSVS